MLNLKNDENIYSLEENIVGAILSGIGGLNALTMLVLGVIKCAINGSATGIITVAIWLSGVFLFCIMDLLAHSISSLKVKKVFLILTNCFLHFAICGICAFYGICVIGGAIGWSVFGVACFFSVLSIIFNATMFDKFSLYSFIFVVLNLWMSALFASFFIVDSNIKCAFSVVVASVLYTIGGVFYVLGKRMNGVHIIFHIFILLGMTVNFVTIHTFAS